MADKLSFFFWNDDGDNVYEKDEKPLTKGFAKDVLGDVRWALQDSKNQNLEEGGPLVGSKTYYIGKVFCYGQLTDKPLPQDPNPANNPSEDNDGDGDIDAADGGFICDGSKVGNISQSDLLEGDVVFEAVQARHNDDFLCNPPATPTGGQ